MEVFSIRTPQSAIRTWCLRCLTRAARALCPDKVLIVCNRADVDGLVHVQRHVERLQSEARELQLRLAAETELRTRLAFELGELQLQRQEAEGSGVGGQGSEILSCLLAFVEREEAAAPYSSSPLREDARIAIAKAEANPQSAIRNPQSSTACPACGMVCAGLLSPPAASRQGTDVPTVCSHCGLLLVAVVQLVALRGASEAEVWQYLKEAPHVACVQRLIRLGSGQRLVVASGQSTAFELSEKDLDQLARARRAEL